MLKRITLLALCALTLSTTFAQEPVQWNFTAKKIANQTYEIYMTATVNKPWHMYSQHTPDGGPLPTKVQFAKNPLLNMQGDVKENGKLVKKREEVFDLDVQYFDGNATFVQTVTVKGKVKTTLTGTVEYMVCNETQCLPPKTIPFKVNL
jgi:hypothetical protein